MFNQLKLAIFSKRNFKRKPKMTEQNSQSWRAVAIQKDSTEHLLCLGNTYLELKRLYAESFNDLLTEDEQKNVDKISVERWRGESSCGRWLRQDMFRVPNPVQSNFFANIEEEAISLEIIQETLHTL